MSSAVMALASYEPWWQLCYIKNTDSSVMPTNCTCMYLEWVLRPAQYLLPSKAAPQNRLRLSHWELDYLWKNIACSTALCSQIDCTHITLVEVHKQYYYRIMYCKVTWTIIIFLVTWGCLASRISMCFIPLITTEYTWLV